MEQILCYENEVWKDIPNYEGLYQASSLGRIRTAEGKTTYTERHGARRWKSRIMRGRGDYRKTGRRVSLWKNGVVKDWLVARLVAITFLGYPKNGANTVNHKNGDRLDNRLENIEWLSLGDNIRHAFDTGLMPYKKVKLYNQDCEMVFRSQSVASKYIGRNHGYINLCLFKQKPIKDANGNVYQIEFLQPKENNNDF